ncbi:hypothetical protein PENTCL1PPCAC_198, partial [Pristionchus entomophagus]
QYPAMFSRKEIIGGKKIGEQVHVTDQSVDVLQFARAIADDHNVKGIDDAFMVINLDALCERVELWRRELPHIEPFYAVKCNSDQTLLSTLAAMGVGFDCASRSEIELVLSLGVTPDRIIFANPHKSRSFIGHAEAQGVNLMTFDNAEEMEKIARHHNRAKLLLRIACPDPSATHPLSIKFGVEPGQAASGLLKLAAERGLCIRGICFHVGSGSRDASIFRVALQHARLLFDIGRALGHKMDILNVGGGFPGVDHHTPPFQTFASHIRTAVEEFFPDPEVRLLAEPGRFFVEHPCALVLNVLARHAVTADKITGDALDSRSVGHMYHVNDGVYGCFNCIIHDHVQPTGEPLFDVEEVLYPSIVYGPTCDSADKIEHNKMMRVLEVGDWMIYQNMGAYTSVAGSRFNGFERPTAIHVVSEYRW